MKQIINTMNAPVAIGTYSQAVKVNDLVFLSGQIGLDPKTNELIQGDFKAQASQVFANIDAVVQAAGGGLADVVKLSVFVTDMKNFPLVNEVMATYFAKPYPARVVIEVSGLPKGVAVEMDAIVCIAS